ncbi:DNA-directed RNA polymerase subunit omega [Facklamia hominis]|uniref:DNA-directed RNA polymerase subunit omega n=1 Tax=Facklamia hominis TaxID=178214 RepID=UPI0038FBE9A6
MMLYPSIDELLEKEPSKYSLIILASKRARQMHEFKMMQLNQYKSVKTIGKALEEVNADLLSVDRS